MHPLLFAIMYVSGFFISNRRFGNFAAIVAIILAVFAIISTLPACVFWVSVEITAGLVFGFLTDLLLKRLNQ